MSVIDSYLQNELGKGRRTSVRWDACEVVSQGWTFLCRIVNLLSAFRRDDHFFRSRDDSSFTLSPQWALLPDFQVSSDAAGTLGYEAIF